MKRVAVLVAIIAGLAGCVDDGRPEDCDAAQITIELAVDADGMRPDDPGACRDQRVTLVIDPATDGLFHIHGYDDVPVPDLEPGAEVEIEFVADRSGQFPIELHAGGGAEGTEIGVFTVYEP